MPRRLMPLLAALTGAALLLAAPEAASALEIQPQTAPAPQTYSVDCSAATDGDGITAPWNTLASVAAHGDFQPGDRILLKRGTTCRGRLFPRGSGTATAPIVLGAYGSGSRPTVAGGGTANRTGAVQLVNSAYWTIQDLHVTNAAPSRTTTYRSGVLIQNTGAGYLGGITVQRMVVDHVVSDPAYTSANPRYWGGITATTTGGVRNGFVGMQILGNTVTGVSRTGIAIVNLTYTNGRDEDLRVSGNAVRRARGDSIIVQGSVDARIDHNVSTLGASFWPCPQCKRISPQTANAGIWPIFSRNIRIDHNEVSGEHAKGGDGEGFSLDASVENVVLEDNYIHDNEGGGVLFCGSRNAVMRFNILQNNRKSAIAFIGTYPAKNSSIYNNTIFASAGTKADVVRTFNGHRGSGVSFRNNLVFSGGPGRFSWPTATVSTAADTIVGTRGSGAPHDRRTSFANPQLRKPGSGRNGFGSLSGYVPRSHAKAQRGVAIPSTVTVDFFGRRIDPKRPPRGAAG